MIEPQKTIIKLKQMIEVDGAPVKELSMREPLVADMLAVDSADTGDATQEIALIANLCEIKPIALQSLTLRDYGKLQKALSDFTK